MNRRRVIHLGVAALLATAVAFVCWKWRRVPMGPDNVAVQESNRNAQPNGDLHPVDFKVDLLVSGVESRRVISGDMVPEESAPTPTRFLREVRVMDFKGVPVLGSRLVLRTREGLEIARAMSDTAGHASLECEHTEQAWELTLEATADG